MHPHTHTIENMHTECNKISSCVWVSRVTQAERPITPGDRADDVNLFKKGHPKRGSELSCGYCDMCCACDDDLWFAGHQHHHRCLYVWDGNT